MQKKPAFKGIVGIDIGGTFTDFVLYIPDTSASQPAQNSNQRSPHTATMLMYKVPSTPHDPSQGLLEGLRILRADQETAIVHGSTVATNTLLERKGAKAVLITTRGFADVLEIGRQDRPELYNLMQERPPVLITEERRLELAERLDYHGNVLQAPSQEDLQAICEQINQLQPESLAVSLLYAFRNPEHEQQLATVLQKYFPDIPVSLSSLILPQFREYERTSTIAVNAYVQPVMSHYLHNLQSAINVPLRIMQSSGGSIQASTAAQEPVRTVLSGPAGGVIGAFHVAKLAGYDRIITLDMGGTSTDVALCNGSIPYTTEAIVGGCPVSVQTVAIHTVGAGGGSIARLDEGRALTVGPESAGAVPGPVSYGTGDALTVTDANIVLGRIEPTSFLGGRFSLYPERAMEYMTRLAHLMHKDVQKTALGIIQVVNASMERALRAVSLEQGHDPRLFTLVPFGGAGALHACELAQALRIPRVFIPRYPGVMSALGMILAPVVKDYVQTIMTDVEHLTDQQLENLFTPLEQRAHLEMTQEQESNYTEQSEITLERLYDFRYRGQAYEITTPHLPSVQAIIDQFHTLHQQRFGHSHPDQPVQLVAIRIKAIWQPEQPDLPTEPYSGKDSRAALTGTKMITFHSHTLQAKIYQRAQLHHGNRIEGPALLIQDDSTTLLPPDWQATVDAWGNLLAEPSQSNPVLSDNTHENVTDQHSFHLINSQEPTFDAISLEIFKHLFSSVAEEMGTILGRTSYSPNIKERKDYSCACFDYEGQLIAQAAHIPVHLGAMPASVQTAIAHFKDFEPGDLIILNDPFLGGTHLPDITLIKPVFIAEDKDGQTGKLCGFVASRAHHADIGGMSPGSMPMSREIYQEGIIIPPLKLAKGGLLNEDLLTLFYRNVRTPWERQGDLQAQIAAAAIGEQRLQEIVARYGSRQVQIHATALLDYSAHMTEQVLAQLAENEVQYTDYLDNDGWGSDALPITVKLRAQQGKLRIDFTGSAPQSPGCVNAVSAVTASGVLYVIRCLVGEHVPVNQGCLRPITLLLPERSLLNASSPAAVAAGNVETSQRTVDVLFGALAQLAPDRIPAASQGTMNNITFGGYEPKRQRAFAYYETMGGGMGGRPGANGLSGVHVHMSNTRNTPIEALEMELPVRIQSYTLRRGSGGAGKYRGGNGLSRTYHFLVPAQVTLLTDRRVTAPYGLHGGQAGMIGINTLQRNQTITQLPGKVTFDVQAGDLVTIATPGGGGFLSEEEEK